MERHTILGTVGQELTAEAFAALGVTLGSAERAALGWCGGDAAAMLARALGSGLCAGGAAVLAHDGCCPATAAWLGGYYDLPLSLFVEQVEDRVWLRCFGSDGLPHALEGTGSDVPSVRVGHWDPLAGVNSTWAADLCRRLCVSLPSMPTVAVPGQGRWDGVAADTLERMGCRVLRRPAPGVPSFSADRGGFWLLAADEAGHTADPARLLALVSHLAREQSPSAPSLRCALFTAGFLVTEMARRHAPLSALLTRCAPPAGAPVSAPNGQF